MNTYFNGEKEKRSLKNRPNIEWKKELVLKKKFKMLDLGIKEHLELLNIFDLIFLINF